MRPKLSCYGGHIVEICLLFYIAKANVFTCDDHSVKGTLNCKSGECCTPQLTNVIKANITGTNYLCVWGGLYGIKNKLPGQKCVTVSLACDVELSYCYTEETLSTLPPSDNQSTPILEIETASSPGDEKVTNVQHDETSIVSDFMDNPTTRNALNSEETRRNTRTSFNDGVIIGVPVVAAFLVVIVVSVFLFIRHQRKRRKQSTTSPFNTVVRFSNAEYAQTRSYGNSHERIDLTTLVQHEVADATVYSDIDQRDSSLENGGIYNSVAIKVPEYANVPCACLMEDGDRVQKNPVELDKAYDHAKITDDNNMYDSTNQKDISFIDNYDHTIPFQDREDDTYECT